MMADLARLQRFMRPRSIAVIGGAAAQTAIAQTRGLGFDGPIWPVNPHRTTMTGLPCYPSIVDLPEPPDAALIAVPSAAAVKTVGQLADIGAQGAVCHTAGFAEAGANGAELEEALVAAAGSMPVLGPNCIGIVNYLDGAALWPDQHGGNRIDRGVAVITQSGNIAQNISMQRRGLPVAFLATLGNAAQVSTADLLAACLEDDRITAIGLHMESIGDLAALSLAADRARAQHVPIIALKSGTSELGEQANLSHTNSLASPDVLVDALFSRLGIGRVHDVPTFVETLKLLHLHGAIAGNTLISASCSGGEAALVADAAATAGLVMPPLGEAVSSRLRAHLGQGVSVRNPLDYHTRIWGDEQAQQECFAQVLSAQADFHVLTLDVPRDDRSDRGIWMGTLRAFVGAHAQVPTPAGVVSLLPEGLPEDVSAELVNGGIVPFQGLPEALRALAVAAQIGAARSTFEPFTPSAGESPVAGPLDTVPVDEADGKAVLADHGVTVPASRVVTTARQAGDAATALGYPIVAKALRPSLLHKSDIGAVRLDLYSARDVATAVAAMAGLGDRFLIERMVSDGVAELIVGVRKDPAFGMVLTLGLGGVLVEVLNDTATVLLPAGPEDIERALRSLRLWPLLDGARGRPKADVTAAVRAIAAIIDVVAESGGAVSEVEVNPLIVRARGNGAVAADVVLRQTHAAQPTQPAISKGPPISKGMV